MERRETIQFDGYKDLKLETVCKYGGHYPAEVYELTITVGNTVQTIRLSRQEREQLARMFNDG